MRKALIILTLITTLALTAMGQLALTPSVVSAAGNYYAGNDLSISWTIGDLVISTLKGENLTLTQGFQQPTGIGTGILPKELQGNIFVYPNPARDELFIRFEILNGGDYLLELQDVTGRITVQRIYKQVAPNDIIRLTALPDAPGIYFLKLVESGAEVPFVTSVRIIR